MSDMAMENHDHDVLVIEDNNAFLMAMGEGSRIEIHAADAAKDSWAQLSQNAHAGDSTLHFTEDTGWEVGDQIAIAPSGQDYTEDEERTIVSISPDGRTVTLDRPLEFDHYGELETYTDGDDSWDVDMRAEVALLSRNVTIQGDADSVVDGFGAHTMVMDGAEQHISGAEFYRVGQEDILGRYPIHWHMLGDASGQYVTNVSVHQSYQKGSTIHGTSNILYEDNVIYDHVGHGVFMEDGSEFGNVIKDNLVFGTHASRTGEPIPTDRTDVSSYWIENVSNTFIGNHAAGSENVGFFIAPATEAGPHGLSEGMNVPNDASDFYFVGNTASSSEFGVFLDGHIDGDTLEHVDGQNFSLDGSLWFVDTTAYANNEVGLWSFKGNASDNYVVIMEAKLADNASNLEVRGDDLLFVDSVSIGESGNIAADKNVANFGVKTYRNSDAAMVDVHFANFNNHNEDIAISLQQGELKDYGDNFQDITFENVSNELVFRDITALLRPDDAFNTVARDDGSLTGVDGGAWITRNIPGELERSGYNSYADPKLDNAWITTEGAMGVTEFYLFGKRADQQKEITVTRSVDKLKFEQDSWLTREGGGGEDLYQFITPTADDQEAAFLVELGGPDNVFPTRFNLSLDGIRVGEAVVYEIPNVASFSSSFDVNDVNSMDELFAADSTSAFVEGGSLFIRVVGMRATNETYLGTSPDEQVFGEFMGTESPFGYAVSFDITPLAPNNSSFQDYGEATFDPNLLNSLARTDGYVSTKSANTELVIPDAPVAHEIHESTSDTVVVTNNMARWSDAEAWGGAEPGADDIIVVGPGETIVIDQSATVKGIIVDGGNLLVEDAQGGPQDAIELVADYVLVINGGLFQAGTETDPLDREFTLELTGDDPDFDLHVGDILNGMVQNTLFASGGDQGGTPPVDDPIEPPPGEDVQVWGTQGDDEINGSSANETIFAQSGNDTIRGNNGNDTIHTGEGDDVAFGGNGDDVAHGFYGEDSIHGGAGNDYVTGGFGEDEVYGDVGDDEVYGDDGNDVVYGGTGNDKVGGDNHDDVLYGGAGDDELWGGPLDSGNDILIGGAGADLLGGGDGNDIYRFEATTDSTAESRDTILGFVAGVDLLDVSELGITGLNDLTITTSGGQTIVAHNGSGFEIMMQGRHTLQASSFIFAEVEPPADDPIDPNPDNVIRGTAGDDTLQGTNADDTLYGNDGDDLLRGVNGDDTAFGGAGNDNLQGGNGNDTLNGGEGDDYLAGSYDDDVVSGGSGDDEVYGDYGADILYGNSGNDMVGGGDDDDILYGGEGDDRLIGGLGDESGNDILVGGAGADNLNGGVGNDVYLFETARDSTANRLDTIQQFSVTDDTLDVSALGITSIDELTFTLTGNQTIVRHTGSQFEVLIQGRHTLLASNFVFAEPDDPVDVGSGTVQGRLFTDMDGNGAYDQDADVGGAGHRVQLLLDGEWVATTTTNANGFYSFQDVAPGDGYSVRVFHEDAETEFDLAGGGSLGEAGNYNTPTFAVEADQTVRQNAILEAPMDDTVDPGPGAVMGWFYTDMNGNGAFDRTLDVGVAGRRVELHQDGEVIATTSTNSNGFYSFHDVAAGDEYSVRFFHDNAATEFVIADGGVLGGLGNLNSPTITVEDSGTAHQNALLEAPSDDGTARLELGTLDLYQDGTDRWVRVDFEAEIEDAVVVVGPASANGDSPTTVRVRNVDETGFDVQLAEWAYLDQAHMTESISWMAATAGVHTLADGTMVQAGTIGVENETWADVAFDTAFDDTPIVFSQVATGNGADPVTSRNHGVTQSGFTTLMQEEEARPNHHVAEEIDWIAVEGIDGLFTTGRVTADENWEIVGRVDEVFLADMQTMAGWNTAVLRTQENTRGMLEIMVQEETSGDEETHHRFENIGYLTAETGSHTLTAFDMT
ncbi:MAG: SdrD B-like domain-containing protein [Pseudomonadota bacterium]